MEDLQVHHIQPRGRLGDDAAENLITLCAACHEKTIGNPKITGHRLNVCVKSIRLGTEKCTCSFGKWNRWSV
jgi:5-methylcytosine-specific restriction endonuclease McrA